MIEKLDDNIYLIDGEKYDRRNVSDYLYIERRLEETEADTVEADTVEAEEIEETE